MTTYSTTSHVAFISKKRFLGGWLAGEVLLPLVDLDVQLANRTESRARGFGDLTVGSGLQWAPKKIGNGIFVSRVMIDVGVPTGKYSDSRPVKTAPPREVLLIAAHGFSLRGGSVTRQLRS